MRNRILLVSTLFLSGLLLLSKSVIHTKAQGGGCSPNHTCHATAAYSSLASAVATAIDGDTIAVDQSNATWGMPPTAQVQVGVVGTLGATKYVYRVAAFRTDQNLGLLHNVGTSAQQVSGPATLSGGNYNAITWSPVPGADYYQVYRVCYNAAGDTNCNAGSNPPAPPYQLGRASGNIAQGVGTITFNDTSPGVLGTYTNVELPTDVPLLAINHNISIIGSGQNKTILIMAGCKSIVFNTRYQQDAGPTVTVPEVRLSNMSIVGNSACAVPFGSQIEVDGYSQNIRFDHITWDGPGGKIHFYQGWTYGVVDHFNLAPTGDWNGPWFMVSTPGWPASVPFTVPPAPNGLTIEQGDTSWNQRGQDHWATAKNWYFEDGVVMPNGHFVGSYEAGGAWWVARHMSTHGSFSGHGNDTTGPRARSIRSQELYNTYFATPESTSIALNEWRGASGNVFNTRFNANSNATNKPFAVDSYRANNNYGGNSFNSSDGTGLFDVNDRSIIGLDGNTLNTCANMNQVDSDSQRKHGSDATNKPCVPDKGDSTNPYGTIFAAGTGATVTTGTCFSGSQTCQKVSLPGMPALTADQLTGYTVRDPTSVPPASRTLNCGDVRKWAPLAHHNSFNGVGTVTLEYGFDNACPSGKGPITFAAGGAWEIRHVLHVIDEPGSGKGDPVTGSGSVATGPKPFHWEWDFVYQWANQTRTDSSHAWDTSNACMDTAYCPVGGATNWWGMGAGQQASKAHFTDRGLRNGLRTVGYNDDGGDGSNASFNHAYPGTGSYPVFDISGYDTTQKKYARRIGADDDPTLLPHNDMIIDYVASPGTATPGQATMPSSNAIWGYRYPHNLVSGAVVGSTAITSAQSATFATGASVSCSIPTVNCYQTTTSGFTATPDYSISGISGPGGTTSLPANVAFNNITGILQGSATGAAAGQYNMTLNATHSPDAPASLPFILNIGANDLPTVQITAPTGGSAFTTAQVVTLTATASDTDGNIASVTFKEGSTTLSVVPGPAASYSFSGQYLVGSHTITAQALDNQGGLSTVDSVTFSVSLGPTPTPIGAVEVRP